MAKSYLQQFKDNTEYTKNGEIHHYKCKQGLWEVSADSEFQAKFLAGVEFATYYKKGRYKCLG